MFLRRRPPNKTREQDARIEDSQRILSEAASATAAIAADVTFILKSRLDDADKRFAAATRLIADALFLCDKNGIVEAANPASHRLCGRDLVGQPLVTFFNHGIIENWLTFVTNASAPHAVSSSSGTIFVETRCERLDLSDRKSYLVLVQDVTDLVEHHAWRMASQQSDAILLVKSGVVVASNEQIKAVLGYEVADVLGCRKDRFFSNVEWTRVGAKEGQYFAQGLTKSGSFVDLLVTALTIEGHGERERLLTLRPINTSATQNV